MSIYTSTQDLLPQLNSETIKRGDIKKMAKEIKKDHDLAMELWASESFNARLLAVLIMDKNLLDQPAIDSLAEGLATHEPFERNSITEWLMANQLMKSKKTIALLESWQNHPSPILRRLFWYHQARLRWTGKIDHANTEALLNALDSDMENEEEEVQWAMNFTAGWIGVFDTQYRERCVALGERLELYKGLPVPRNCTPDYLPEFIEIEVGKRA